VEFGRGKGECGMKQKEDEKLKAESAKLREGWTVV
jgi:hypothetical protein